MQSSLVLIGLVTSLAATSDPLVGRAATVDLIDLIPEPTTSLMSWRSGADTALLEERIERVADAALDARFDQFLFEAMATLGAPTDLVDELRAVRNVVASLGGIVPWRELVAEEVVYAETSLSTLLPCVELPGMLLVCRPAAGRADALEDSVAGLMGAVAGTVGFLRYDIDDGEIGTRRYELVLRGGGNGGRDAALVQLAVRDGVFLLGMGEEYFDEATGLLAGGDGPRLSESPRFREAFGDLPRHAAGRSYVDMSLLVEDLDQLSARLTDRAFNAGLWQGVLNGALDLAGTVETVASTTRCEGSLLTTETLTRFDPGSPAIARAGLSEPASADLLSFVPADAVSFDMRGEVDLVSLFRWGIERWREDWAPAEDVVWVADVLQAVLGLSLEEDLVSWLGSEHVAIEVPSGNGASDTVVVFRVGDEAPVAKVLERAENVFHALAPRLLANLQEFCIEAQIPLTLDVQLLPGSRRYPDLRQLHVNAFPFLMSQMVYGTRDGLLLFATSEGALTACLDVAAGEAPGLFDRSLAAPLVGRADLCSARLEPMGRGLGQALEGIGTLAGLLQGASESMAQEDPQAAVLVDLGLDLLARVEDILVELDFLGDAVTSGEVRQGGLARYERTTIQLRGAGTGDLPPQPLADAAH